MDRKANSKLTSSPKKTVKRSNKGAKTILSILNSLDKESADIAKYDLPGEGILNSVLRATFTKSFQYARYCNCIKPSKADEACFFLASALRGICEDLIALQFIRQLPASERDEVITIEMARALGKAVSEQAKFFKTARPFQPVVAYREETDTVTRRKLRIDEIGEISGLWKPNKGKLPSIEQMSDRVGLRWVYDYFYRISSDVVHFNPRIALRSGWSKDKDGRTGHFSTANFSRYYLFCGQIYGAFLFVQLCRAFESDLELSKSFMSGVRTIEKDLQEILRWPEAVTYEELNSQKPSELFRLVLKVAHEEKWDKNAWVHNLREISEVARELGKDEPTLFARK